MGNCLFLDITCSEMFMIYMGGSLSIQSCIFHIFICIRIAIHPQATIVRVWSVEVIYKLWFNHVNYGMFGSTLPLHDFGNSFLELVSL